MKYLWFKKTTVIVMALVFLLAFTACGSYEVRQNNDHDMEQKWSEGNDSDVPYDDPQTDGGKVMADDPFDGDIPDEELESNPGPIQKDVIIGEWVHEEGGMSYYFYSDDSYAMTDPYDTYYGVYTFDGYTLIVDDYSGIVENGYFDFSEGSHLYLENTRGKFYYNGKENSTSFDGVHGGNVTPDDPFEGDITPDEVYTDDDSEEMPHVMIQKDSIVGEWEHESGDFNYYLYMDDSFEVREGEEIFYGTYSFDGEVILLDDGSGFPVNGTFDFSDGGHLYIEGALGRFYFNGR